MPTQQILWNVLPWGRETFEGPWTGRRRVSIVVSPRLTPQAADEQQLRAFDEWLDWPATLARCSFDLEIAGGVVGLRPVLRPELTPDSDLWRRLFPPTLGVSGFQFKDMSRVNLRSFPVRNVLGFVRQHYASMSAQAGSGGHPTLLPWRAADPALKGMLAELGTRTQTVVLGDRSIEVPLPGFGRFHRRPEGGDGPGPHERIVNGAVFDDASCIKAPAQVPGSEGKGVQFPLRALPPDWEDPALIRNGTIQVAAADREARAQLMEQFSGPAEYAMWQADRFYRRTVPTKAQLEMKRPAMAGGTAPLAPPEFDFHQRVASYADHPNLLRRLGLVIDCVLEKEDGIDAMLAAASPAQGTMRLQLHSGPPHLAAGDVFPRMAWSATRHRFVVAARTTDHADGLLRLERADDRHLPRDPRESSQFDIYQLDPDGAALKTVNFTLTAQNLVARSLATGADGQVTYTTGDRQPVASLRSGGLGVSRHGRAGQVGMAAADAVLTQQAIGSAGGRPSVTLYAEDVLRGYRIDVLEREAGRWRSLCARQGDVTALPAAEGEAPLPVKLPPDEGYVKGASTTSNEDTPDDHYLHETLFRWTGWSLAVPRPGRTLRDSTLPGTHLQTEEIVVVDDTASSGNGIAVRFRPVKGTLPRLRYGHEYRVRARLVDLAGNSLALDDPDLGEVEHATEPVAYGRFEPLDPPPLALRRKLSEGESLERLVLRSNFDRTTADYTADIAGPLAALYGNPDFEYGEVAERHAVPPKASQQTCELHGLFDAAIGSQDAARAKAAYAIAARENGSLMHPVPGAQIELVTPAKAGEAATVQGDGALIKPPEQGDPKRDRFAAGQYVVHREAIVPVPYLPDPACGGIALHGVPGIERLVAGKPLQALAPGLPGVVIDTGLRAAFVTASKSWMLLVDMDTNPQDAEGAPDWPDDMRSLRLVLAEQPGEVETPPCGDEHTASDAPEWDAEAGVLRIFLPKGHIARLRYASFVHDRLVGHFGLPRWQDDNGAMRLRAEAMAGANWMVTPWRGLTLVHATQQPVCKPWMETVSVRRDPGSQHADLNARRVHLHGPSTGKFEIVGEWDEWIDDPLNDDPAHPGPRRIPHQAALSEIRLDENHANVFGLQDAVDAQTRFIPVGGQVQPTDLAKRPAAPGNRHEFGDTRFRFVHYHLRATTRFREYLPPELFAKPSMITCDGPEVTEDHVEARTLPGSTVASDAGAPVIAVGPGTAGAIEGLIVPASAPPAVPEMVIVLPTFRWERPAPANDTLQSTRWGNGLRVYLDRPWFSSGDGELLGVVIAGDNAAFDAITATLVPFVTQWGGDPLWDGTAPVTKSHVADFPAVVNSEPVSLIEAPGGPSVVVVGHRVHFDPTRKLWYCDVELNPGLAYMPFVRLALVRYQPNAIAGANVSRVVLAEFAQVLPRRKAVLQRRRAALTLNVYGPVPERGPMRSFNAGGQGESDYADISFVPPLGVAQETGRNRMELVLQTRDASLATDLGWEDTAVLASGPAAPGGAPAANGAQFAGGLAISPDALLQPVRDAQLTVRSRGGQPLRFDRMELRPEAAAAHLGPLAGIRVTDGAADRVRVPPFPPLFDPAIWTASAQVPATPGGRESRLMLREFERFYTDRTVPEVRAGAVRRRVVVEERLVYAEVFEL
jgi:hypothetical protein